MQISILNHFTKVSIGTPFTCHKHIVLRITYLMYHALTNLRLPILSALEAVGVALVIGHGLVDTLGAGLDERTILDNLDKRLEVFEAWGMRVNLQVGSKAYQQPR